MRLTDYIGKRREDYEGVALKNAIARDALATATGNPDLSVAQAADYRIAVETAISCVTDDDKRIKVSALYPDWESGNHAVGDIYNAAGQTWECYQAYDNAIYPDIHPGQPAWYTFNRPLHGKTPETARPWVTPTGAHDIYKSGEYMIFTDGKLYECKQDTNFSPAEYAGAWEEVDG